MVEFEAYDSPTGEVVNVRLGYTKGSHNRPRGIYLFLLEVTREFSKWGVSESFMMFGDPNSAEWGNRSMTFLLEELKRGNPKKLATWADALDPRLDAAMAAFRARDESALKLAVYSAFPAFTLKQGAA